MKRTLLLAAIIFVVTAARGQIHYEILIDEKNPQEKLLKGLISKDVLKNDSTYKWYAANQKIYTNPDPSIVKAFATSKDSVNYIVFGGTWCEDSQFILPKFFILQEKAGISDDRITFVAVDRQKQATGNLSSAFNVINVPTIIVMKNGRERGRVVEYGKSGKWDKELADILNQ